jgi:hypothetical protein
MNFLNKISSLWKGKPKQPTPTEVIPTRGDTNYEDTLIKNDDLVAIQTYLDRLSYQDQYFFTMKLQKNRRNLRVVMSARHDVGVRVSRVLEDSKAQAKSMTPGHKTLAAQVQKNNYDSIINKGVTVANMFVDGVNTAISAGAWGWEKIWPSPKVPQRVTIDSHQFTKRPLTTARA